MSRELIASFNLANRHGPDALVAEIVEDLRAALEQFEAVGEELGR